MTPNPTHPAGGAGAVKVPDGWALVPIKLTTEMREATWRSQYEFTNARLCMPRNVIDECTRQKMDDPEQEGQDRSAYRAMIAAAPTPPVPEPEAEGEAVANDYADYDAGLLNDWGGGNVDWWQDYLRAEIGRANEFWRTQVDRPSPEAEIADLRAKLELMQAERDAWRKDHAGLYALYMERNKERDGLRAKLDRVGRALAAADDAAVEVITARGSYGDENLAYAVSEAIRQALSLAAEEKTGASDV